MNRLTSIPMHMNFAIGKCDDGLTSFGTVRMEKQIYRNIQKYKGI